MPVSTSYMPQAGECKKALRVERRLCAELPIRELGSEKEKTDTQYLPARSFWQYYTVTFRLIIIVTRERERGA